MVNPWVKKMDAWSERHEYIAEAMNAWVEARRKSLHQKDWYPEPRDFRMWIKSEGWKFWKKPLVQRPGESSSQFEERRWQEWDRLYKKMRDPDRAPSSQMTPLSCTVQHKHRLPEYVGTTQDTSKPMKLAFRDRWKDEPIRGARTQRQAARDRAGEYAAIQQKIWKEEKKEEKKKVKEVKRENKERLGARCDEYVARERALRYPEEAARNKKKQEYWLG